VLALLLAGPGTASAATKITFDASRAVPRYGANVTFSGVVSVDGTPTAGRAVDLILNAGSGWQVRGSVAPGAGGRFAFVLPATVPGRYAAQTPSDADPTVMVASTPVTLTLRPRLRARIRGLRYPGSPLYLKGRLQPRRAGVLTVRVGTHRWRVSLGPYGRFSTRLPTRRPGSFTAVPRVSPAAGFTRARRERDYRIRAPSLSLGSRGRAVLALERRLRKLHFAIRGVNRYYGTATYEAVLAFQKVHRMSRTGTVGLAFWRALGKAHIPRARVDRGAHIEVDKTRQVLFEVRHGRVVRVIHVSTGATGNTPIGRWHVYLKTPGLNGSGMYYSNYFLRGFAIHGYHSVPAYPASHGCVRIPMWQAPGLYARWPLGTTIYIYYS
jgi:hypothetical protein